MKLLKAVFGTILVAAPVEFFLVVVIHAAHLGIQCSVVREYGMNIWSVRDCLSAYFLAPHLLVPLYLAYGVSLFSMAYKSMRFVCSR